MYYVTDDDQVDSVYDTGDDARKSAIWFRSPEVAHGLSYLALFNMLLSFTAAPGIPGQPDWLGTLSYVLQIMIWIIFCVVCLIRLKYMWKARSKWFAGAREPPWIVCQAVVLFIVTPVELVAGWSQGHEKYNQANGSVVECP